MNSWWYTTIESFKAFSYELLNKIIRWYLLSICVTNSWIVRWIHQSHCQLAVPKKMMNWQKEEWKGIIRNSLKIRTEIKRLYASIYHDLMLRYQQQYHEEMLLLYARIHELIALTLIRYALLVLANDSWIQGLIQRLSSKHKSLHRFTDSRICKWICGKICKQIQFKAWFTGLVQNIKVFTDLQILEYANEFVAKYANKFMNSRLDSPP